MSEPNRSGAGVSAKNAMSPDSANSLLAELRSSQAAVANDVSELVVNVGVLSDVLAEIQKSRVLILSERQTALEAIQAKLDIAVASIRAVSRYPVSADNSEFQQPQHLGHFQEP